MIDENAALALAEKSRRMIEADPARFEMELPGTSGRWTAKNLVDLYACQKMNSRPTQEEMAKIVNFERSTISRKLSSMNWEEFERKLADLCNLPDEEYTSRLVADQHTRILAAEALRMNKKHIHVGAWAKHVEERILANVAPMRKALLPVIEIPKHDAATCSESMVLMLSDFHVGQEFSRSETGGLNEYNKEVFLRRAANLRKILVSIFQNCSRLHPIHELHVFALGDFVQGSNLGGNWGPAYNTMDIGEQAATAAQVISEMVDSWRNMFQRITISGVVGNHGRAGVSKNSDKVSANWDNMVYTIIKANMARHENVSMDFSKAWWLQRNVNGHEFMLVHGDNLPGNIGNLQKVEREMQTLTASGTGKNFKYLCCGHFHRYAELETNHGAILMNGSMVGGDVHSMKELKSISKPTQAIFGVHPRYGITWKHNVDLDLER